MGALKISNETRVGILAAVGIILLVLGFNFLKGKDIFNPGTDYHVSYSNTNGLNEGDAVLVNGYKVGKVKNISLKKDNTGVDVLVNLTENIKIPEDSYVELGGDLLGEKYLSIRLGVSEETVPPDGWLKGSVEVDIQSQIKLLSLKINLMINSIDTTINVLSSMFNENVKEDFQKSMAGIKNSLEIFNNSAERINTLLEKEEPHISGIITDVSSITNSVNNSKENLQKIISNLESITDTLSGVPWQDLSGDFQQALANINAISEKISSGEGSLGKLVNDEDLYNSFVNSLDSLSVALHNFSENPEIRVKFHVFGK